MYVCTSSLKMFRHAFRVVWEQCNFKHYAVRQTTWLLWWSPCSFLVTTGSRCLTLCNFCIPWHSIWLQGSGITEQYTQHSALYEQAQQVLPSNLHVHQLALHLLTAWCIRIWQLSYVHKYVCTYINTHVHKRLAHRIPCYAWTHSWLVLLTHEWCARQWTHAQTLRPYYPNVA